MAYLAALGYAVGLEVAMLVQLDLEGPGVVAEVAELHLRVTAPTESAALRALALRLEELEQAEDAEDNRVADERMAKPDLIPHDEVMRELGLR